MSLYQFSKLERLEECQYFCPHNSFFKFLSNNTMTTLKLVASAKANGTVPVYKYESQSTGLKVVLANVEGNFLFHFQISLL